MDVYLDSPQRFNNLCAMVRTLEVFGFSRCFVHDPNRLVRGQYGRRRRREAQTISAGSFARVELIRIEDPSQWLAGWSGRIVATTPAPQAISLPDFQFHDTDLIAFGGESHGLPPWLLAQSTAQITIPQHGQTNSLNVSVAVGVVLYSAIQHIG